MMMGCDSNNNDSKTKSQYADEDDEEEKQEEVEHPEWVLEYLANSDLLYWKRETPGAKVKFRCDVQVREFLKETTSCRKSGLSKSGNTPSSGYDPWLQDTVRCRVEEMPPPSPVLAAFCLAAMAAILGYQWAL